MWERFVKLQLHFVKIAKVTEPMSLNPNPPLSFGLQTSFHLISETFRGGISV